MKKFLISLCLSACCILSEAQNANPIQEAMANYDYETALSLIEQETPTLPLLYQKGKALKGLGYNKKALQVFLEVAAFDSLNPRAYIEVAECSKSQGLYPQALNYYQKALVLKPENKYVHLQYIKQLITNKNYPEALKESAILSKKDSSAQVLNLKAECTEQILGPVLGPPYALEAYQLIQKKFPDDFLSAARLAKTCIDLAQYGSAIQFTDIYRNIDTTNVIVNRLNAQAYCLEKLYPTAIERYESLLQNGDSTFYTCFYAGICYYATKKYEQAILLFQKALKENGADINAHYYVGRAYAKIGQGKKGTEHLEMALEYTIPADSTVSMLYDGLVECYKAAGRYKDQAAAIMKQYEQYAPDRHVLLYNAAYIYQYRLKNIAKAKQLLLQFLDTRPKESKQKKQPDTHRIPVIVPQDPDEEQSSIDNLTKKYIAAEYWLENLLKREKEEKFFKGEME